MEILRYDQDRQRAVFPLTDVYEKREEIMIQIRIFNPQEKVTKAFEGEKSDLIRKDGAFIKQIRELICSAIDENSTVEISTR